MVIKEELDIQDKLLSLERLAEVLESLRLKDKRIVQCHGCFDLLHIGHIRHFRQAKRHGDVLVVTVTPDRFVDKGPGRPAFPEKLRAEGYSQYRPRFPNDSPDNRKLNRRVEVSFEL